MHLRWPVVVQTLSSLFDRKPRYAVDGQMVLKEYSKYLKNSDPWKIAVIILKFE